MYKLNGEYLAQYGVPGMRWGNRKSNGRKPVAKRTMLREQSLKKRKLSKRELMRLAEMEKKAKLENIKNMTLKELSEAVERNRLEATLRDQINPKPVEKKKYIDVKQIGANAVTRSGEKVVEQLLSVSAAAAINKLVGSEVVIANKIKKKKKK